MRRASLERSFSFGHLKKMKWFTTLEVVTAVFLKTEIFCNVMLYPWKKISPNFEGKGCCHLQGLAVHEEQPFGKISFFRHSHLYDLDLSFGTAIPLGPLGEQDGSTIFWEMLGHTLRKMRHPIPEDLNLQSNLISIRRVWWLLQCF